MFHNYLITALRNFTRHKLYSFINVAGLTVGLTCAIFIILFVRDELSYDKWIPGTENLYRVGTTFTFQGQPPFVWAVAPFPAPDAMLAELPEVKAAVHLQPGRMTVATGNRQFLDQVQVVSPNFFLIIRLPLLAGNRSALFAHPESAVISESAARKYFGSRPALGQVLKVGGLCEYGDENVSGCVIRGATVSVTGVMRDLPHNTQLSGDVFIPNTSAADPMSQVEKGKWIDASGYGYVVLQTNANARSVAAKLPALVDRNFDPRKTESISLRGSQVIQLALTPFRDHHLSDRQGSMTPNGSWTTVYGFIAIGVLILLMACFNFTNLATARAIVRAREISLRKVVGARRSQLVVQFLGESVLIALLSFILALALVEILLPLYDRMLGRPIQFHYLGEWFLLLALLGMAILVGIVGGLYPALVLSSFRPGSVLRTSTTGQSGSGIFRNLLVVMQFGASVGLGIAAMVVFAQISFARSVDLGFNKDGIVSIFAGGLELPARQGLVRALNADPRLRGAALSRDMPLGGFDNDSIEIPGVPGTMRIDTVGVGPDFFSLYNIRLLSGRALSDSDGQDVWRADSSSADILINRAAAEHFGYTPQSALGKTFYRDAPSARVKRVRLTIVGVTSDFMFHGVRNEVAPTYYRYVPDDNSIISVRVPASGIPT